ncbi:MAG TPA: cysteine desulfurase family protein [Syntrophorhabdaceae bacterium]|nr:cysteine desulfurase family protein [Syntrophorhabdaceae bacterium]HOT41492.1 cysteine desulfurase family protein [Syntrophorhabdaceae bacterium]HPC65953.1 cysteine desulfurase family protein [Syntrophorhabdaceae bacterium]HQH42422.1 cysteine desulfurase family protein [Syntrophorhabdaceae bacterium]HQK45429.1 cysteine desulfurase family protein [Syntrophorhabdaceae bacterium]
MELIYFDHISGTPLHPLVKEVMIKYIEEGGFGNPSSQHRIGDAAIETLEDARTKVSALINAKPEEIVFTSGGTESVNHAIKGVAFARAKKGKHIITSNIEHQSVSRTLRVLMGMGYQVTAVPVDRYGMIDPSDVEKAIRDDTILVTIMHANNEIGTIEPIAEIGKTTRERGVLLHTDAVVSCGNIPVDVEEMNVDLLSMAANQFYGPPGVGALFIKEKTPIYPLIDGGTQENNKRAGTQNLIGIVGMAKAAELARLDMPTRTEHLLSLKRYFLEQLKGIDDIVINGHPEKSLPGLVSFSVEYVEGESMMIMLDEKGICVSTRSACASGSLRASHVLIAIGSDYATAQGTLLFSFGIDNTKAQIDKAFDVLKDTVAFLRNISPLYKKK